MKDTLYIDKSDGKYFMFTYSDGSKVYIGFHYDIADCYIYAKNKNYKVIEIK